MGACTKACSCSHCLARASTPAAVGTRKPVPGQHAEQARRVCRVRPAERGCFTWQNTRPIWCQRDLLPKDEH